MKNNLRINAKKIRCTLNIDEKSALIKDKLFDLPEFKQAKNIFAYYSFGSEINTHDYFSDSTKNWFLPKIEGDNLLVCPYDEEKLTVNSYQIKEPLTNSIQDICMIDMLIIPALAADKHGYRIGYGKGFYDRFIANLKHSPVKVVLVCSELLFNTVYPDDFDEKCDIIITDKEIYRINC